MPATIPQPLDRRFLSGTLTDGNGSVTLPEGVWRIVYVIINYISNATVGNRTPWFQLENADVGPTIQGWAGIAATAQPASTSRFYVFSGAGRPQAELALSGTTSYYETCPPAPISSFLDIVNVGTVTPQAGDSGTVWVCIDRVA